MLPRAALRPSAAAALLHPAPCLHPTLAPTVTPTLSACRALPPPCWLTHPPDRSLAASEAFDMVYDGGKSDDITVLCSVLN